MKLASYRHAGRDSYGLVTENGMVDLGSRFPKADLRALIETGRLGETRTFAGHAADFTLEAVEFLPVIPNPRHFYCVGVNYADHLEEARKAGLDRPTPKQPSLFIRFPETLIGADQPMIVPKVSDQLDFEAELAIVVGKGGRYISKENALAHVAGYTCFNDGSVRDWQFHSSQVTSGKNFVGTGALGPWMVTVDELPDPSSLDVRMRVNGEVMQDSNTRHLIFDVPAIVSYTSALVPLQPGDVIATGTPDGVGFARKPPIFLKEGDVCEVFVAGIGTLSNPVIKERA